jgi:hypothetical protein
MFWERMMKTKEKTPRGVLIIRWVARIWSLAVLIMALLIVFSPDEHSTGAQLPARDIFMLSLWGVAIFGLLLAWLWEEFGGLFTIIVMFFRELTFFLLYNEWNINFLLIWGAFIPPAILFLVAASRDRKAKERFTKKGGWDVLMND